MQECIDRRGVAFLDNAGVSAGGFLELLSVYLKSTYVCFHDKTFIQRNGICIDSCIAPILSDLYLAKLDRKINEHLDESKVLKVFRYVDDYLVVVDSEAWLPHTPGCVSSRKGAQRGWQSETRGQHVTGIPRTNESLR